MCVCVCVCVYRYMFIYLKLYAQYLEEGMATHSSILASRIPWAEEPGRLQSTWLHRFVYN